MATNIKEQARLAAQDQLDKAKSQAERNRLGQFATPTALATDILEYAWRMWSPDRPVRFLDPAFGTGSFYSALLKVFPQAYLAHTAGYEIDPSYGQRASELWGDTPLRLTIADFTRVVPPAADQAKPNLVICNPPYVRHHHLSHSEKQRLQAVATRACEARIGGLAGLYCYFLCLSHGWMADDGLAGWLIPSEFMDVNYGKSVKEYLLNRVTLLHIHRFDPGEVQFGDALVSSAVVWFTKARPVPGHTVKFTYGGSLAEPAVTRHVAADVLRQTAKWTALPLMPDRNERHQAREVDLAHVTLSDLFTIKRGMATGSNDFFILTAEQASKHDIPWEFLRPVLPNPRNLLTDEVKADEAGNPSVGQQRLLLSCNLPEDEVMARYPSLWQYLQRGAEAGVSSGYLCRHRSPWYAQEDRPAAPLLCTYMGRKDTRSGRPFRFILNHSRATAANVYLMLYPKAALQRVLTASPAALRLVWQILNQLPSETLLGEGRVYGGGLHKLEPRELGNAPADGIVGLLPALDRDLPTQLRLLEPAQRYARRNAEPSGVTPLR